LAADERGRTRIRTKNKAKTLGKVFSGSRHPR